MMPKQNSLSNSGVDPKVIWDTRSAENSNWIVFLQDIHASQKKLHNFKLTLTVRKQEPTKGEVQFMHEELPSFRSLKAFTGDYGFVVPVMVAGGRKVLRGEKKLKYTRL